MDMLSALTNQEFGIFMRIMCWLVGVDKETLAQCPKRDADNVTAIGFLMIAVWIYQATVFSMVSHRILANDGTLHFELLLGSGFIATMVLLIDSYMVMRSGWNLHGIEELKRGGIDISGGLGPQIRNAIFLVFRILLSIALAQLCAIFTALIFFHADIDAQIEKLYQAQNADLFATVRIQVDADNQRAAGAVDSQSARVSALDGLLAKMRQGAVDPTANDAQIEAAQADLSTLTAAKAKRDEELVAAQVFDANEMAGIKGEAANSGKAGNGPVRAGAQERLAAAKDNDAAAAQAESDARQRLDDLRKQSAALGGDQIKLAQGQLPSLEEQYRNETAELVGLRAKLADQTASRESSIREGVETAPNHVDYDRGLLGQLDALKQVAQGDPQVVSMIILIDAVSFGLELAAVLAKVTSFIPTTYSALLARNIYMRTVEIVRAMDQELRRGPSEPIDHLEAPPSDEAEEGKEQDDNEGPANDNTGSVSAPDGTPPRRPRGRPPRPR